MGKRPHDKPKEEVLYDLVQRLAQAGCQVKWKGRTPFYSRQSGPKTAQFWDVWGGAVDKNPRSRWLNFDPDHDRYTGGVEDTERKILAIINCDDSEHLFEKPKLPIAFAHEDDGQLLPREAARLIYQHWREATNGLLERTRTELQRVRNERRRLYSSTSVSQASWLGPLAKSLADFAKLLELDDAAVPLHDPSIRRKLFLRPVHWTNVCRGGYAERPLLRRGILRTFAAFLADCESRINNLQLPVFWIGGRSGDGKSVLLLQLCRILKQDDPSLALALFNTPDALVDWIETVALGGKLPDAPAIFLAVVDDLHKVSDWDRARSALENSATLGLRLAVVTCGPNPERTLFVEEVMGTGNLALTKSDTTRLEPDDMEVLAAHLGVQLQSGGKSKPTLVEQVFLTLTEEVSIDNFARSLKSRVDGRLRRDNLLAQLAAMAWLDLPLPLELVSDAESEWLTQLAGETQLHISVVEDGFRFGHPAIARPVFDALTRPGSQTPLLRLRITQTISQILNDVESTPTIRRILRQVLGRLKTEHEIDVAATLDYVIGQATTLRLKAVAVAFLMFHSKTDDNKNSHELHRLGRTCCQNVSLDPETRAFLAGNLALSNNADERDLRTALDLINDPAVGPYMGTFLVRLCKQQYRKLGWTFRSIGQASKWVSEYPDHSVAQHVLVGFLSNYPSDTRLHEAAKVVVRENQAGNRLTSFFMGQIAKCLEDEFEDSIRIWLMRHRTSSVCSDALVALLKKPGNKWDGFAEDYLDAMRSDDPNRLTAVAALVPHISSEYLLGKVLQLAAKHVEAPAADRSVGGFFTRLAEFATVLGAEQVIGNRLDALWKPETLADTEGERQACLLLGRSWSSLADRHDSFPDRARHLFERLHELERQSAGAGLSKGSDRLRTGLRGGVMMILRNGRHLRLCWRSILAYYDARPTDELSGIAAAQLVMLDDASEDGDEWGAEWLRRKNKLIEACWTWAERTNLSDQAVSHLCTVALLKRRWDDETEALRALIRSYWEPHPRYGADQVLQAWLRDDRCSGEAWEWILDQRYNLERYDKLRARVLARNLDYVFDKLNQGNLEPYPRRYLLRLLETGVGDFEINEDAAWAALQRLDRWPKVAEAALWRGVLRSARMGFTLRRDSYEIPFKLWQEINKDEACKSIINEKST